MKNTFKKLTFTTWIFLFSVQGWSAQAFDRSPSAVTKILKIQIRGNKKIEIPSILDKIESAKTLIYSKAQIRKDIQALFDTGFFYDVSVDKKNSGSKVILTYTVIEKPSIVAVNFVGNSKIKDAELSEAIGIKNFELLNTSRISEGVEKVEKLYEEKGYFLARIEHKIENVKTGAKIIFIINENDQVRVKQIRILGNHNIPTDKLKSSIRTQEGGFFSFMSSGDSFKKDIFDQDMRMLNFLYFNEGYIQAKIDRPQVFVTPDKKDIYITIRVDEGEQYKIGGISFAGDIIFDEQEVRDKLKLNVGDMFSSQKLQLDLREIQAKYGDLGYAYANPIPRTDIRPQEKKVYITYEVEKGQKVYINKIKVVGNTRTRDKVVRRELKILEGELYNESRKRESEEGVKRLGFFEKVTFSTSTPDGRQDQMDIDIIVKERNTGSLQVGAGYGSQQGFVFMGQINQTNLFGKGQKLGAALNVNSNKTDFSVNFTEPYFKDTKWSVGFDAYHNSDESSEFKQDKTGGAFRVGHPIAAYTYGFLRYKVDYTKITLIEGDKDIFPVETANGQTNSITASVQYDKRNDRFVPSEGMFSSLSLEYAGLFGGISYTKGLANFRYYHTVFWDVIWRNNLVYGFVNSNGSGEPPFNQRFLLGGPNTLRGYYYSTVGKRKRSKAAFDQAQADGKSNEESEVLALRPFGGEQQFYYNLEFMFPLVKEARVHGVVFYDIGEAQDTIDFSDLKSNFGFGFRWISPLGPLRFEWGFPVSPDVRFHPDEMFFNFHIGTPF